MNPIAGADERGIAGREAPLRILEIGDRTIFKSTRPASTTMCWSGPQRDPWPGLGVELLTWRTLRRAREHLHQGRYDVVVCHPPEKTPWQEFRRRRSDLRHVWMYAFLRGLVSAPAVPLVVVDSSDPVRIPAHTLSLLPRAALFYKRELALDPARMLPPRKRDHWRRVVEENRRKLRPFSLGVPDARFAQMPREPVAKQTDVFFAGQRHTRLRSAELPQLMALARRGLSIDVPAGRLAPAEFFRRCAAAWLVWSPEGSGWDCFRHYEAAACRSVPVMNRPSIRCRDPLREGEHGFYYDPERRELADVVARALADKPRLERMAEAGRAHVLRHHTHAAACEDILAALGTRRDGG